MSIAASDTPSAPRKQNATMSGCPPNRPSSSASTAAVASSSASGVPSLLRQDRQRKGSQRGTGLAQRGQVVRGGSPGGTDSRKTVPRSAAPASAPAATPTAAHARFMPEHVSPRVGGGNRPAGEPAGRRPVSADRPACRPADGKSWPAGRFRAGPAIPQGFALDTGGTGPSSPGAETAAHRPP